MDGHDLGRRPTWSHLVADAAGIPLLTPSTAGTLGERARATAGFRDQFYGLVPFVADGHDEAPLVTTGLLDPGRCAWGERPTRYAGRNFARPVVDLGQAGDGAADLARWVTARRRPKVVLATQTAVLEAAVDDTGRWVPSVPVISVEPGEATSDEALWALGAVVGSPVASAWAAATYLGAGLGATSIKLSAAQVHHMPWPAGPLDEAARRLRAGDVDGAATATTAAYGLDADQRDEVLAWWRRRISATRPPRPARANGR